MKRWAILALMGSLLASPLYAALKPGAHAPDFTTQATLGGKPFTFALADALKAGVLGEENKVEMPIIVGRTEPTPGGEAA